MRAALKVINLHSMNGENTMGGVRPAGTLEIIPWTEPIPLEAGRPAPLGAKWHINPADQYVMGLSSPKSRRTVPTHLSMAARAITGKPDTTYLDIPWHLVDRDVLIRIKAKLRDRYSAATVNNTLGCIRGTLAAAEELGQMSPAQLVGCMKVKNVTHDRGDVLAGRALAIEEVTALVKAAKSRPSPWAERDGALLALLFGAGARRFEATGLDLANWDPVEEQLRVVGGKGNKDRESYLAPGGPALINAWIKVRGDAPGPLLLPIHNLTNRITHQAEHCHETSVNKWLDRLVEIAGIAHCTPHDLRRTLITETYDRTHDLYAVQKTVGHKLGSKVTAHYTRRPKRRIKEAISTVPGLGGEVAPSPIVDGRSAASTELATARVEIERLRADLDRERAQVQALTAALIARVAPGAAS